MIIISSNIVENTINIPKNTDKIVNSGYTLDLHSDTTNKDYSFTGLTDISSSKLFWKFIVDFTDLSNAEFNYTLKGDNNILSYGLIRIGDYKPAYDNSIKYNKKKEFVEYHG